MFIVYIFIICFISLSLSIVSLINNKSDKFENEDDLFVICENKTLYNCRQNPNCNWNSRLPGPSGLGSCRMSRQLMGSFGNSRIIRS